MKKLLLILTLSASGLMSAPFVLAGPSSSVSTAGLDLEWTARARNFDNRAGTWKTIIFGDDTFTNNANAVSSQTNWTGGNTITGSFSLIFSPLLSTGPLGSLDFSTANHSLSAAQVGVDADTTDGGITDLVILAQDAANASISLRNLSINGVSIDNFATDLAGNQSLSVRISGLNGEAFTLTGSYSVTIPDSVSDEAPRIDFLAYSGGSAVPEPSTYALMGAGLIAMVYARRRR
jgi:hypothetical protein